MAFSTPYGIFCSLVLGLMGLHADAAVLVTLKSGANVTGQEIPTAVGGDAINFLGIPYAKPPIGKLRFKPPQPHPEDWHGSLGAFSYGAVCQHPDVYQDRFSDYSEDCLFINVHVPGESIDNSAPKAVMVGIHGGGLMFGASQMYYGSNLAVLGDVIVVTMNYRLNIYGFLTSGSDAIPGNMGLMDQNLALQWVQNNIESFGGDKSRVTIFGESSGGHSVSLLVQSPLSKGLFQRAISMSGFVADPIPVSHREDKRQSTKELAERINCPVHNEDEMTECFQSASVDDLNALATLMIPDMYSMVIDGEGGVLPDRPDVILSSGRYNFVDYMAGIVKEEGYVFFNFKEIFDESVHEALSDLSNGVDASTVKLLVSHVKWKEPVSGPSIHMLAIEKYFPDLSDPWANMRGMIDLWTDFEASSPTIHGLDLISVRSPTYLYYFTHTGAPTVVIPQIDSGVRHGEEMNYLFAYVTSYNFTDEDISVAVSMIHAWSTFAKTGEPQFLDSNSEVIAWPKYNTSARKYLEIRYPMGRDSVKERLLSDRVSFHNNIVTALTDPSLCQDDNPSLISRDDAETALFVLIFVTVCLILAIVVVLANQTTASK